MRHRSAHALTAAALAVALTGCGITNPYSARTHTPPAETTTQTSPPVSSTTADPTPVHERNGTISPAAAASQHALANDAAASTPQAALRTYVLLYINWTSKTVAVNQRRLAAISLAGARAQALQAAMSYGSDSVLQTSQLRNAGQVLSISRGRASAAGSWVVVTRESTTGSGDYQGLPAQDHVYLAQLTHVNSGWVISAWTPKT
jgi:hypothetical protein